MENSLSESYDHELKYAEATAELIKNPSSRFTVRSFLEALRNDVDEAWLIFLQLGEAVTAKRKSQKTTTETLEAFHRAYNSHESGIQA